MRVSSLVRWILIVPSAIVAWYFAFLVGIVLMIVVGWTCGNTDVPQPQYCTAGWFKALERGVFFFGTGLAAVLVVTASSLIAPSHRTIVAWTAVGIGAAVALVMGVAAEAIPEALAAIVFGCLTAFAVARVFRGRPQS